MLQILNPGMTNKDNFIPYEHTTILKLFSKPNIIGLVADVHQGKSMLIYHIIETIKTYYSASIYSYGLRLNVPNVQNIYSLSELEQVKNSVIFIDEMSSLFDLDNRKVKHQIENTLRLIFHNNNVLFLCGVGENWKKFLSAKIEIIFYKKLTLSDLINGSRVKEMIMSYKGIERGTAILNLEVDKTLLFDGEHYSTLTIPYLKKYDTKAKNQDILQQK